MEGFAYVFLRKDGAPLPPGCAGHVGWGFSFATSPTDTDAFCGSTENTNGGPIVLPGGDNGYWDARVNHENDMLFQFRRRNYNACKRAKVAVAYPDNAFHKAREQGASGYLAVGNNCLDHVFRVLEAYGVKDLPWPAKYNAPNEWFGVFNGAYLDL